MALWDFDAIKTEVRGLTMKRSINQVSESELEDYVNRYLFYKFPQEVNPPELHNVYEFPTVDGTSTYTIDQDEVVAFDGTVFMSDTDTIGDPGTVWIDPNLFYLQYPTETSTDENEPTDFLIYSGEIVAMPIPDAVYYIKMPCIIRPTTLSAASDIPSAGGKEYEEWGSVIAHGAALDILEKTGEDDRYSKVQEWYRREKLYLKKKGVFQDASKRPYCKF